MLEVHAQETREPRLAVSLSAVVHAAEFGHKIPQHFSNHRRSLITRTRSPTTIDHRDVIFAGMNVFVTIQTLIMHSKCFRPHPPLCCVLVAQKEIRITRTADCGPQSWNRNILFAIGLRFNDYASILIYTLYSPNTTSN